MSWQNDTQKELDKIEEGAKLALSRYKDKPYFDELVSAYVSGYVQSKVDDVVKLLKGVRDELLKSEDECTCESCQKLN